MATTKITDLTAYTDPISTDVVPIVDVTSDVTKKVSIADLMENAGSGTEALPGISFDGDPNTGIYRPGADQVAISTGGTGRLFVDASGNVGVGAIPTGYAGYVTFMNNGSSGATYEQKIAGALTGSLTTDSQVTLKSVTSIPLTFGTNNTERLRITSDGKVGIGTTSPGTYNANLAVYSAGGGFSSVLHANASGSFPKVSAIALGSDAVNYTYSTNGGTVAVVGSAHIAALQSASSGASTDIAFINTSSGSVSEKARIDSSGRLLLGTSSDFTNGSGTAIQSVATAGGQIALGRDASSLATGNLVGRIRWFSNVGGTAEETAKISVEADGTYALGDKPSRLVFSTTADGASSPTERMRIKSDGTINFSNVAVYADNAAAKTGGLVDGDVYRTSTGDLKIVYT